MMHFGDPRLPARFWDKVQPEPMTGCWLFVGAQAKGYGHLGMNGKVLRAHRIAFMVENEVPDGMVVDHKCRVRCCVNPDHLRAIPESENVMIGFGPTAINARKEKCPYGHGYSGENLAVYVRRNGARNRACRTCQRIRDALVRARRKAAA